MKLGFASLFLCGFAVSVSSLVAQEAQPLAVPASKPAPLAAPAVNPLISRIALGSCMKQDRPMPVLRTVREFQPELFVWLGDNIYGDTYDMDVLAAKYARLGRQPDFSALRAEVPMVATWDDHDYGVNDGGREYPKKEASRKSSCVSGASPPRPPVANGPASTRVIASPIPRASAPCSSSSWIPGPSVRRW